MIWALLILLFSAKSCFAAVNVDEIIVLTNNLRIENGLSTLVVNLKLNQAAQLKANDVVDNNYWSHISPSGITPWDWINMVDYKYSIAGENLARGYSESTDVLKAWKDSPTHLNNILTPQVCEIGVAVKNEIVVQMLACPVKNKLWYFW